jgi:hypothetical protein
MRRDMDAIRLAVVFKDQAQFFEQDALFGNGFHMAASDKINGEIKAAGNCLAADLGTAAVFHLIRAAEAGLRALAIDLGATLKQQYPIEYAEWFTVIALIGEALEKRSNSAQSNMTRGPAKDAELAFYNGLLSDLNYFKDAYRNPVAHFRGEYNLAKALAVYDDVKRFMLRLATKVPLK